METSTIYVCMVKVLDCLQQRYASSKYYTKAGSTLVAVNPYREVACLYGPKVIRSQFTCEQGVDLKTSTPHVYSVAQRAYHNIKSTLQPKHQSVIVSGESGSGKTVSGRHVMRYLVTVSGLDEQSDQQKPDSSWIEPLSGGHDIEKKILDSNPILEAFGNASTLRNDNSSRFGKYVELHFNSTHHIVGATLKTYLLEKSRVVHQAPDEYNFHIFYQLLQADSRYVLDLCGEDVLNNTNCDALNLANLERRSGDHDVMKYKEVVAALCDLGLEENQIYSIWEVLIAMLLLCSVKFACEFDNQEACDIEETQLAVQDKVAELLGLDSSSLEVTLTRRKITAQHAKRKSVFHKPCSALEAANRRDCVAKLLYDRLFEWIVQFINSHISDSVDNKGISNIGILDIYGFESFTHNSLEQLCINYANEKLQQHFVQHFLRDLQEEYVREALPFTVCDITDNSSCLQLLEGRPGLIALLDEVCRLNRPLDSAALSAHLLTSLDQPEITRPDKACKQQGFTVVHYVHPVTYATEGLLDKNKDDIPAEILQLLQQSDNTFIQTLMADYFIEEQGLKKKTVLTKFKLSLTTLMQTLEQTEPHYIRCIKPNTHCSAHQFDKSFVLSQLQACGVEETVNISKQTFPVRMEYPVFLKYFSLILRSRDPAVSRSNNNQLNITGSAETNMYEPLELLYQKQLDITPRKSQSPRRNQRRRAGKSVFVLGLSSADHTRKLCATLMKTVFGDEYRDNNLYTQFGKTQLFLKDGQLERLECVRLRCLSERAFTVQCAWRRHKQRARLTRLQATCLLQSNIRGWLVRQDIGHKQAAATCIQRLYRQYVTKCKNQANTYHHKVINSDELENSDYDKIKGSKESEKSIYNMNKISDALEELSFKGDQCDSNDGFKSMTPTSLADDNSLHLNLSMDEDESTVDICKDNNTISKDNNNVAAITETKVSTCDDETCGNNNIRVRVNDGGEERTDGVCANCSHVIAEKEAAPASRWGLGWVTGHISKDVVLLGGLVALSVYLGKHNS